LLRVGWQRLTSLAAEIRRSSTREGAMTKLNLQIAHQVPGRLRMKIPASKGNPDLLKQISETFGVIPGIQQITVNPTTGSIVLHYDVDRHDEFYGTFQHHYDAHRQDRQPSNEIDELTRHIEDEGRRRLLSAMIPTRAACIIEAITAVGAATRMPMPQSTITSDRKRLKSPDAGVCPARSTDSRPPRRTHPCPVARARPCRHR
jgi:hypothetical protein